jgi:alkanesulfonate monooxygenase SsuD/methylene tetrahydromethanopterin reductase-like flavin-dependent oxidoreductase (luciferase family)
VTTVGAVFLPQLPPERLRAVARAADEAGLEELWLWEDCFRESGVASAAAALAWTERLVVGVGLLPVPLRNVALTAMEVATLHRLFPGRVHVGVGHGVQDWMGQVGGRVDSPVTLLREYVVALRALLRGEEVTTRGVYIRLDKVALDWPPPVPPALFAGATGPRSLRLCGEVADGTILTGGTTTAGVREARRLVEEGRVAAGRDQPQPLIVAGRAAPGGRDPGVRRRPRPGRGGRRRGDGRGRRAEVGGRWCRHRRSPADRRRPRPRGLRALRGARGAPAGLLMPLRRGDAGCARWAPEAAPAWPGAVAKQVARLGHPRCPGTRG